MTFRFSNGGTVFRIKDGDTYRPIELTIYDDDGEAFDLDEVDSAELRVVVAEETVAFALTLGDDTGELTYQPVDAFFSALDAGKFSCEVWLTMLDATVLPVPTHGVNYIEIEASIAPAP